MVEEGVERLKEKESSYLAIVIGQVRNESLNLRKGETKIELYLGDISELMAASIDGEGKEAVEDSSQTILMKSNL